MRGVYDVVTMDLEETKGSDEVSVSLIRFRLCLAWSGGSGTVSVLGLFSEEETSLLLSIRAV